MCIPQISLYRAGGESQEDDNGLSLGKNKLLAKVEGDSAYFKVFPRTDSSFNQSIDQSINQSVNQSVNQIYSMLMVSTEKCTPDETTNKRFVFLIKIVYTKNLSTILI